MRDALVLVVLVALDNVWWLGFDTAHLSDLVPGMAYRCPPTHDHHDVYRGLDYVRGQVLQLAAQAAARARCEG